MGKLGAYEYPETTLSDALTIGRRIAREFMGTVSRSGLARSLGMSDRGGGFGARIGAMRIWGVAEGRGTIRLTRDGLRAVNPLGPEEAGEARRQLAASVPVFVELARRLGGMPPDRTRVAILLEDLTGENRIQLERRLPLFARIFEDVLPLLAFGEGDAAASVPAMAAEASSEAAAGVPSVFLDIPRLLEDRPGAGAGAGADAGEGREESPPRIEVVFPGGRISLSETVASLDVIIQVLQERRGNLARGAGFGA